MDTRAEDYTINYLEWRLEMSKTMSDKLKDIIRIEEKEETDDFSSSISPIEVRTHNTLLNRGVEVDVKAINIALCNAKLEYIDNSKIKMSLLKFYANAIKTAILSGKVIKEKRG